MSDELFPTLLKEMMSYLSFCKIIIRVKYIIVLLSTVVW